MSATETNRFADFAVRKCNEDGLIFQTFKIR
jgi:hypothetical protein